jgi:hypothetical protein
MSNSLDLELDLMIGQAVSGGSPVDTFYLFQEDGFRILQEDGTGILTENA